MSGARTTRPVAIRSSSTLPASAWSGSAPAAGTPASTSAWPRSPTSPAPRWPGVRAAAQAMDRRGHRVSPVYRVTPAVGYLASPIR